MHINLPFTHNGKWCVEVVYYPESRSVETYQFDTRKEAYDFYNANHSTDEQSK